jgi:hypothetical protein
VQAAEREDPVGFVQALKARGYFTGNETAYIKSVTWLSKQALAAGFDAVGSRPEGAPSPAPGNAPVAFTVALVQPLGGANAALRTAASPALTPASSEASPRARFESSLFADEVTRAELLMSALRIARSDEERG